MAELDLTQMRIDIDEEMAHYHIGDVLEDGTRTGKITLDQTTADGMLYVDGSEQIPVQRELIAGDGIVISGDKKRNISASINEKTLAPYMKFIKEDDGLVEASSEDPAWHGVIGQDALVTEDWIKKYYYNKTDIRNLLTVDYGSCGFYSTLESGKDTEKRIYSGSNQWFSFGTNAFREVGATGDNGIASIDSSGTTVTIHKPGTYKITTTQIFERDSDLSEKWTHQTPHRCQAVFKKRSMNQKDWGTTNEWINHTTATTGVWTTTSLFVQGIIDINDWGTWTDQPLYLRIDLYFFDDGIDNSLYARINFDSCNIIVDRIA